MRNDATLWKKRLKSSRLTGLIECVAHESVLSIGLLVHLSRVTAVLFYIIHSCITHTNTSTPVAVSKTSKLAKTILVRKKNEYI
jgi:hypothetical protein